MGPLLLAAGEGLLIGARFLGAAAMRYAVRPVMGYLAGSTPRWASWGLTAVGAGGPLLFNKIENGSGGKITQDLIETAVAGIKEGIKDGTITKENLEEGIRDAISVTEMMSSADTMGHTATVMAAIGGTDNPTQEQLQRGKAASIGWVVTHPVMPMARFMLRAAAAEDIYPDAREKERYLAKGFVEDLVSAARIAPLEKHNAAVTEADIKTFLREQKQAGHLDELFKHCPALKRGLNDLYPDLFVAPEIKAGAENKSAPVEKPPAPVATATPAPQSGAKPESKPSDTMMDFSKLSGPALTAAFDKVAADLESRGPMGWVASKLLGAAKGISSIFNDFGMNDVADRFDRLLLGMAKGALEMQFGNRFDTNNLANLAPKPKKPDISVPELALGQH